MTTNKQLAYWIEAALQMESVKEAQLVLLRKGQEDDEGSVIYACVLGLAIIGMFKDIELALASIEAEIDVLATASFIDNYLKIAARILDIPVTIADWMDDLHTSISATEIAHRLQSVSIASAS
jgi:hypothetical protein